ncbi:MAG: hypothetical protein LUG95_03720 [Clostridiales bacterium]|nr:hypothetical protein [Clostridiales bacterium]
MRKPSVIVKDGNGNEISSEYYMVTYASGRKNVDKYKVTVKFSGNYSDTKTLYFKIKPVSTKLTSVDISKKNIVVKWEKKTKQVTGYQIQLSTTKKFKKGTTVTFTNKNSKKTKFTLKGAASVSGKTYYVRIRTYKTVNGVKYYSAWSAAKTVKTK